MAVADFEERRLRNRRENSAASSAVADLSWSFSVLSRINPMATMIGFGECVPPFFVACGKPFSLPKVSVERRSLQQAET
jgi:hypothetical protein